MENLFYSKDEKILFYVAGYTDNSSNVKDIVSLLNNNYEHLKRISGGVKEINTIFISESPRYKHMRVFYCVSNIIPDDAFIIGGGENKWTMMQWLTT